MYVEPELLPNPSRYTNFNNQFCQANDQNMRMLFCLDQFNAHKKRHGMSPFPSRFNIDIFPFIFPILFSSSAFILSAFLSPLYNDNVSTAI